MSLNLDPNINDPDGFYDELIAAHQGLSKQDSDDSQSVARSLA